MSWSAESARAKVKRVSANLQTLDEELGAYVATNPYTVAPQFEPETGWHSITLTPRAPDPIFGLLIGEAAHNLRSALDHVAWQLANLDGAPSQPTRVEFPIFSKRREPKNFAKHPSVNGMRSEHVTILESLQPYCAGHGKTALELLAWVNNTDKHRLLHTTATLASKLVPHFLQARPGYEIERAEFGYSGVLEASTEIGRILITPANADLQVNMEIAPAISVAFGDRDSPVFGIAADGFLKYLAEQVEGVIAVFDRPGQSGLPPWP